jgi:tubulin epsilon
MVTVQVGQCGNQIGRRFWAELLREAAAQQQSGYSKGRDRYDAAMSAFFRNLDDRYEPAVDLNVGSALSSLRARAILIDTEETVVSETLRDPVFGDLFEETQLITDVSGAGNNWAHGYVAYGQKYGDEIEGAARRALEACDSPQAFFFMHSVGGGTGSGLGSFTLERLRDIFPELCRFSVAVYPSNEDEDVITAPYNAVLATQWLSETADCVVPLENQALLNVSTRQICNSSLSSSSKSGFDEINDIAAQLLSHLTAGARYSGGLNIDVNEIATNLVPFPHLHYLTASFAPLSICDWGADECSSRGKTNNKDSSIRHPRHVQRLFSDACAPASRLVVSYGEESARGTTLACALFARGDVVSADVVAAAERLRPNLRLPNWNPEGFKIGLCIVPPLRTPRAVLCLNNSTTIARNFDHLKGRFSKLYRAKAMLHHYTQYIDTCILDGALENLEALIAGYDAALRRSAAT